VLQPVAFLLLGLVLLAGGAHALVRGSVRLAAAAGVSRLFIGLTLVAWGTSSPELVVSGMAAFRLEPGVAVGNVVGSNIFNTAIVLGLSALVAPITCQPGLVRREVLVVIATTIVLLLTVFWSGELSRPEAALFLLALFAITAWSYRQARKGNERNGRGDAAKGGDRRAVWKSLLLAAFGLVLLVVGARWVVDSAIELAAELGVSKTVIGLTIVAAGTSLPELAASVVAALRGEHDIAIGNVLGSNMFNMLGILGVAGLLRPLSIPDRIISFDIPAALLFAIACIPIGATGHRISRPEGGMLVVGYCVYLALLLMRAGAAG
jgi:cation:H+ antiporter